MYVPLHNFYIGRRACLRVKGICLKRAFFISKTAFSSRNGGHAPIWFWRFKAISFFFFGWGGGGVIVEPK